MAPAKCTPPTRSKQAVGLGDALLGRMVLTVGMTLRSLGALTQITHRRRCLKPLHDAWPQRRDITALACRVTLICVLPRTAPVCLRARPRPLMRQLTVYQSTCAVRCGVLHVHALPSLHAGC